MKQEEKDLLLKDLSGRLLYGVKVKITSRESKNRIVHLTVDNICHLTSEWWSECKPYLYPLSSMTEEQAKEMQEIIGNPKDACIMRKMDGLELWLDCVDTDPTIGLDIIFEIQDWLNRNHFDYHGLIEKGLALDATGLNIY